MEELSIKERAQRYDKAIERVVNIRTGKCETTFVFTEGLFNYLFPELEESNGEEVREAMIDFFKHEREEGVVVSHYGVNIERMIAWLEKQGQVNETIISQHEDKICKENNDSLTSEDERIRKALINGFNKLDKSAVWYNGITNGQILAWLEKQKTSEEAIQYLKENHSPSEVSDFQAAMNIAVAKAYDKGMKDGLEKQGKSLDQIHYWTEEEIEPIISDYLRGAEHYGGMIARLRCLKPKSLEKQGGQKFADKVETNFKVGDWVVYYKFGVKDIDKIAKLDNDKVIFESGDWLYIPQLNKDCHLWTIQDAGKGDVLYSPSLSLLWIFKSIDTIYCGCNLNYNDGAFCGEGYIERPTDAIPATKEQRTILFQKMKEAGYEWDAEKKELKEIEQKPIDCNEEYYNEELKSALFASLRDAREQYLREKNAAWSEEDDDNMMMIEDRLRDYLDYIREDSTLKKHIKNSLKEEVSEYIDWLKSIKQRIGGLL